MACALLNSLMMHPNMASRSTGMVYSGMAKNLPSHTDTIDQRRWKAAMMDWLDSFRFTHAITLVWNRSVGLDRARSDLKLLMREVDQRLLGSRFHKVPSRYRTQAMFAFEGYGHDHTHVHSLWKAPAGKWFALGKMFPRKRGGIWNAIVESGSYDVEACSWHGSNPEITGYILKQQHRFSEPALMVWADDFHPAR